MEEHLWVSTRLRYLAVAAGTIPGILVDGRDNTYISTLPGVETAAWLDLLGKSNDLAGAAGALSVGCEDGNDWGVAVYANLKSAYRKEVSSSRKIRGLPKAEKGAGPILARMKAIKELWPTLPNVPGTSGPLVVGGVTAALWATKTEAFEGQVTAASQAESDFSGTLATYHEDLREWDQFVSAALVQNRPLFKPGTPERAVLDRIPTAPATKPPAQAEITSATSPAGGKAQLAFGAKHGTSFEVWHKGPGDEKSAQVANVLLPGEYTATGLPAGAHEYYVVPVNSRGKGEASAPVSIAVAAAAAA